MSESVKNVLVTGNSSGLGKGLTEVLLQQNYQVFGCSRRGCDISGKIRDIHCDLSNLDSIPEAFDKLLAGVKELELVFLNAGVLGEIKDISETSIDEIKSVMDINVWSNKVLLDYLLAASIPIKQIVLISSGAAVLGNRGWGAYALSKSSLNMLTRLYAHEFPDTHLTALAPGLVETPMMDYLCTQTDSEKFTALKRIQQRRSHQSILSARQVARQIMEILPELRQYESGSFVDIRQILAPEEYQELLKARNQCTVAANKT